MTSLREECEALRRKCSELETELASVKPERDDYRDTVDALLSDCDRYLKRIKELEAKFTPATRDRILNSLKLGTQAPGYKAARKALDQFINELDSRGEG